MSMETLKLMRSENCPWGFRLSGGKDFGVILTVQKVNPGSIAADTGLQSGDVVLAINGQDVGNLRHKEAQDVVLKAGNTLEITVQRGGVSSFKPAVAKQTQKPNLTSDMNQQVNSCIDPSSMRTIAQTLTAHAEMIAPGVMGINFMKPEHPVNTRSEVYRLVQEEEQNKAKSPTPPKTPTSVPVMAPRRSAPVKTPPPVAPKPASVVNAQPLPSFLEKKPSQPPPQAIGSCSDCRRYITSAYVRVGDRMLHEDCFRCSTCGTSLQNMGYVNINNKLYCELHAKLAAKVIAAEMESVPSPHVAADLMSASPAPPAAPVFNAAPSAPAPAPAPSMPAPASAPMPGPTPYIPPSSQSLGNLPQTPSSSGGLTFRSISPQPFKRLSGDYHKVAAPSSPTPSSTPSFVQETAGPLPFETKPYMPPGQSLASYQATSQVSQTSHVSQTFQQTTTVSQQSSQFQVDYKQIVGHQKGTKFVWPPPKPEELLNEKKSETPSSSLPSQHYSPLATQSSPPESVPKSAPQSVKETMASVTTQSTQSFVPPPLPATTQSPQSYVPPPLPTTTFTKPAEKPAETAQSATEKKETKPPVTAPTTTVPGFAPVLPPVVDTESKKEGLGGVPQSGVPTGAGSRPAPRRGKGQLKEQIPGCRIPICSDCGSPIRGPFIIALGKTWCPDHFHCNNLHCKVALIDIGFVEEQGQLYCENCYEAFLAPICNKCGSRIKGDCLNALEKSWHPECFLCAYCHKPFGNSSFYLEDGLPYCEKDWNELFTTKCVQCGFPIEAGDRWVEALNNNYHSQCFKCSICSKNLEGQSFYAKGGRPFCKAHAR